MSYIDTIKHERVGTLVGYPIYHPLERSPYRAKTRRGAYDFTCGPLNLVLGGGSGEHPGMVIHRPGQLVIMYLLDYLEGHPVDPKQMASYDKLESLLSDSLKLDYNEWFEYCGWGAEQVVTMVEKCSAYSVQVPYLLAAHHSFERWLALSLGHFCFHHLPKIVGNLVTQLYEEYPELMAQVKPGLFPDVESTPGPALP